MPPAPNQHPEPEASPELLEKNLRALASASPDAARAIGAALPDPSLTFTMTDDGVASATRDGIAMASRRRPLAEAERLAGTIDPEQCGLGVVLGFGLGHHVAALHERLGSGGTVLVVEPDTALLRAVLERVDHAEMLAGGRVALLTDPDDQSAIAAAVNSVSTLVAMGIRYLQHTADARRLAGRLDSFPKKLEPVVRGLRSALMTTLLQVETTVRNELMNADHYARSPGIAHLRGVLNGRTAVVVSAGPSLARNMRLLSEPGVRDRVCIIAVQTTLKPLLDIGVRPHFVTALDYSDISTRFFEGLTRDDVEGVTLIAEPQGNPAILDVYPGRVLCPGNSVLDTALGEELAPLHGDTANQIKPGATVAHLAYYLARHLGCDPVALIGQDLGFTDGQYYAAGASIHNVWASELSAFRSLESLEWERIARQGEHLTALEDVFGRRIYTDEQMNGYLQQFQRDFREAANQGLRTIDATEGGVRKQHTEVMPLAEALDSAQDGPPIDDILACAHKPAAEGRSRRVADRLKKLRGDVWRVGEAGRKAQPILDKAIDAHGDHDRVNELITELNVQRDAAVETGAAYQLVHYINQTGSLKRFRDDRSMGLKGELDPLEKQRLQLRRDRRNVEWLSEAADLLGNVLDTSIAAHEGKAEKITRQPGRPDVTAGAAAKVDVRAVICVDPERSGLGHRRDLGAVIHNGKTALRLTLERLAAAGALDGAVLVAEDPQRAARIAGFDRLTGCINGLEVVIERAEAMPSEDRRRWIGAARLASPANWRGCPGNMTAWDEACFPPAVAAACTRHGIDAAVVVGADWCAVCPDLVRSVVAYHREEPGERPIAFAHAAPGLAPMLLVAPLMKQLATQHATFGAIIRFDPRSPAPDPIGRPICVKGSVAARDLDIRAIADAPWRNAMFAAAGPLLDDSDRTAGALGNAACPVQHVLFETGSNQAAGLVGAWHRTIIGDGLRGPIDVAAVGSVVSELVGRTPELLVSFEAPAGDTLAHDRLPELIAAARDSGAAGVHLRTSLSREVPQAISDAVDLLSLDLFALDAGRYEAVTGRTDHGEVMERAVRAIEQRRLGMPHTIARITRCDAVYEDIERFYNEWNVKAGWAMIDPAPGVTEGDRIAPLPLPALARERRARETLFVLGDGRRGTGGWAEAVASSLDVAGAPIAAS